MVKLKNLFKTCILCVLQKEEDVKNNEEGKNYEKFECVWGKVGSLVSFLVKFDDDCCWKQGRGKVA